MKADSNDNENNRRSLRRRRSEDAESSSSLPLFEQQDDLERSLQPDVECVGWEPAVSQLLPPNGEASIVTDHGLLGPTLAAAGIDFCANETDFEFQHFQYYPEDVSTNATSLDQQSQGWYVKCCDSPGLPEKSKNNSNHALDSLLENQNNESIFEIVSNSSTIPPAVDPLPEIPDGELDCTNYSRTGVPMECHKSLVVGQIVVSSIAVVLSLATVLALTLPLIEKKKRSRSSTYNLYLVFLSIPDCIYNCFLVYLFARFEKYTEKSEPTPNGEFPLIAHPFDLALFSACAAASLYTNAIIAYEILKLLRNSKKRKRSKAPTMRMATKQAACSYLIGVTVYLVDDRAGDFFKGDTLPQWAKHWIVYPIYFVVAIFAPMLYLLWVCFRIYWEKLVGDVRSKAGKRLTVLVRYFSRIIIVYVCIWLPAAILYNFQWFASYNPGLYYYKACIMYAVQVWVSFGLSLSKPDVRKNFKDLLMLRSFQFSSREESQGISKFTNSNFDSREKTSSTADTGEKIKLDNTDNPKDSDDENQDASERCAATEDCEESGDPEDDEDNKSVDVDVFEFDGADAPRERTGQMFGRTLLQRRATMFFGGERQQFTRSDSEPSNPRSSISNPRSSISTMRSQSMRIMREHKSFSEPFDLNASASVSASDPSRSGRSSIFSDENSRRRLRLSVDDTYRLSTTEYTIPLDVMEEDDADVLAISETTTEGLRMSGPSQARSSGSRYSGTRNSGTRNSSRQSDMYHFFMNRDSTIISSSQVSPYLVSDRKRTRWIKYLRKNIRDLAKMLSNKDLTSEQKSIYSQSIILEKKALSIAEAIQIETLEASRKSSISSLDSGRRDKSRSRKISISFALEQINEVSFADRESAVSAFSAEQLQDDVESYGSDDDSDDSTIMSPAESDRVSLAERTSSASSADRLWLSELEENIRDLERRLSLEGLSQEERALLERAIKSQHVTLKSLGGFIEAQGGDSRSSSGKGDHRSTSGRSIGNSFKSLFSKGSLDVIDDISLARADSEDSDTLEESIKKALAEDNLT